MPIEIEYELNIDCSVCDEWVTLDQDQPRHQASGYGFDFKFDNTEHGGSFTCQKCNIPANQNYEEKE